MVRAKSSPRELRTSSLKDSDFLQCMNELDETVASLGDTSSLYPNRRRGFTEDGSISTNSLTTDFGHHVLTRRRVELDGIEKITSGPKHRKSKSLASHRSRGSHRSKGSLSLEQLISETIMKMASPEQFEDMPTSSMNRSSSTDDILRDLQQADAVLTSEGISLPGNLLPPLEHDDEPDLLPPRIGTIEWQNPPKDDDWQNPSQWADWGAWKSSNSKAYSSVEIHSQCQNDSRESGESTWYTFDTDTETSMFSDPFWTDFNNENPFASTDEDYFQPGSARSHFR